MSHPKAWAFGCPPHLALFGDTGSGKTTLSVQLAHETNRVAVYIDPLKVYPERWCDATVDSLTELRKALAAGGEVVVFRPHWDESKAEQQVSDVVRFLFRLSERTPNTDYLLACDEVHQFGGKSNDSSPMVRAHKEGRNADIKAVSISQEPMLVHHSILRQSFHLWGGGVNEYARDYLEGYNLPIEEIKKNGPHDFLVMDKNMEPIDRVRAKEKYATD